MKVDIVGFTINSVLLIGPEYNDCTEETDARWLVFFFFVFFVCFFFCDSITGFSSFSSISRLFPASFTLPFFSLVLALLDGAALPRYGWKSVVAFSGESLHFFQTLEASNRLLEQVCQLIFISFTVCVWLILWYQNIRYSYVPVEERVVRKVFVVNYAGIRYGSGKDMHKYQYSLLFIAFKVTVPFFTIKYIFDSKTLFFERFQKLPFLSSKVLK